MRSVLQQNVYAVYRFDDNFELIELVCRKEQYLLDVSVLFYSNKDFVIVQRLHRLL